MSSDERQRRGSHRTVTLSLARAERACAAMVALLSGGTGAVAVFLSENQAGTVGLLAVGGVFGLLAVGGRLPMRAKWGDKEFEMVDVIEDHVNEAVQRDPDSEVAKELLRLLMELRERTGTDFATRAVNARFSAVEYEQVLGRALAAMDPHISVEAKGGPGDFGLDYIVRRETAAVGVTVKWASGGGRTIPTAAVHAATFAAQQMRSVSQIVLVTNVLPSAAARDALKHSGVRHVLVTDPNDEAEIARLRDVILPALQDVNSD